MFIKIINENNQIEFIERSPYFVAFTAPVRRQLNAHQINALRAYGYKQSFIAQVLVYFFDCTFDGSIDSLMSIVESNFTQILKIRL